MVLMAASRKTSASVGGWVGLGASVGVAPGLAVPNIDGRKEGERNRCDAGDYDRNRGIDPNFGHGRDVGLFLKGGKGMPDHIVRSLRTQVRLGPHGRHGEGVATRRSRRSLTI